MLLKVIILFSKDTNCDIDADECASHPCKNGATCTDHSGYYCCQCETPFKGNVPREKEKQT